MLPESSTEISGKTYYRLLLIAFLVQLAMFSYNIFEEYKYEPQIFADTHIAYLSGDAHSYYEPIESFLEKGIYKSDSYDAGHSYYGRTPYYGMFFGCFRLFLNHTFALDAVITLQLIVGVLASLAFYRLCLIITGRPKIAAISFGIFICMAPVSLHVYRLMTESFSLSFFIISLTLLFRWKISGKVKFLWLSGLFAAYLICMRPFLLPVFAVLVALNIYGAEFRKDVLRKAKWMIIYFIPLIALLTPWIVRNYSISGKIIVFQESVNAGYDYTPADLSLRDLLTATGENFMSWDYDAAGCWFDPLLSTYYKGEYPESMVCTSITKDELYQSKEYYRKGMVDRDSVSMLKADSMFREMRSDFITERPFEYYVIAPFRIMKRAYIHDGVELLKRNTWYEFAYKTAQAILFILTCIGFAVCIFIRQFRLKGYLWMIPILLAIILCIGFRFSERRYFLYCYPVFVLYAAQFYYQMLNRFKPTRQ